MRKINFLYLIVLLLISVTACKKETGSSDSGYYIKANVGGTDKNYTSTPMSITINSGGVYSLSLAASAGGTSGEGLSFQITQNGAPITTGTYSESGSGDYTIAGVYNPGTTDLAEMFGAGMHFSPSVPLQITIINISDKKVSGTFSGEFFDNSGMGSESLIITNGSFNLPIQQ